MAREQHVARHIKTPGPTSAEVVGPGGTVWRVLLVAWILFIWVHSMLPGDTSSSESGFFLSILRPAFDLVGVRDGDLMHLIVRKAAHFSEYLVLGLLATRTLRPRMRGTTGRLAGLCALWVVVPSIDETIQIFTPDRGPAVTDVLIDMVGFAVGATIMAVALALIERRRAGRS